MKKNINSFLILRIINFILLILKLLLFKKTSNPSKIAIYRPGNLGDLVCGITLFYSVRVKFPSAKIILITSIGSGKWGANELFKNTKLFDEIIEYKERDIYSVFDKVKFIKKIRLLKLDLWIDCGNQINTFTFFLRQVIAIKLFNSKSLWLDKCIYLTFFKKYQEKHFFFNDETSRLNNFILSYGVDIIKFPKKMMHDDFYDNSSLVNINNYIVISVGSEQPLLNHWEEKKFIEIVNYLSKTFHVVFIGAPSTKNKVDRIISTMDKNYTNLINKTQIINLFSILHNCKFIFGLDTGTQHVAAFEGADVFTLTSCWNFDNTWSPNGTGKIFTIKNKNKSIKCLFNKDKNGKRVCYYNNNCIDKITTNDVLTAIRDAYK